jgi:hypothetical protein
LIIEIPPIVKLARPTLGIVGVALVFGHGDDRARGPPRVSLFTECGAETGDFVVSGP